MEPAVTSRPTEPRHQLPPPRGRALKATLQDLTFRFGLVAVWGVVVLTFAIITPQKFLSSSNIGTIFGSQAVLVILTMGLLFPLIAAEWDLSVGAVLGFSLTLVGTLNVLDHWPIGIAVICALAAGVLVGVVNAITIVVAQVPSLVATLGMATLLTGLTYGISNLSISGLDTAFVNLGQQQLASVPLPFFYGIALAIVVWYVTRWTPLGRRLFFVGASRDVARLSGIRVDFYRSVALVISATISAFAGIVLAASLGATGPSIGPDYLLPAFAAAFLGATTLTPGRLNVWGSVIAVYFLITGVTGLELIGVPSWIQQVFYGGVLIIAVAISKQAGRKA